MVASPRGRELFSSLRVAQAISAPPEAVVDVVASRCSMCHASQPVWPGIEIAPRGVILDSAESIRREAEAIRIQTVLTHAMPPNNITQMSSEERQVVADWLLRK
jgi:uncharacterized membrane protein